MTLAMILAELKKQKIAVQQKGFSVSVHFSPSDIHKDTLTLSHTLINNHGMTHFISFHGIPTCLLSAAKNQVCYKKNTSVSYSPIIACQHCALKQPCPGWPTGTSLDPLTAIPIKDAPVSLVFEITGECNLNCHCCTSTRHTGHYMPLDKAKELIDEAAEIGVLSIRFTGGEPLLHPQLSEMLAHAKKRQLYVLLNTNATLFKTKGNEDITKNVDNILISLQGHSPTTDQKLTGSSIPFATKIHNILRLRSQVPILRIGTVITRPLIENLTSYAKLIKKLRADSWEIFRPIASPSPITEISVKEYRRLAIEALQIKASGVNIKLANALPFCLLPDMSASTSIMLGAISDDGHSRLIWDPRGYLKPSYFIDHSLGTNILKAWQDPFLEKIRSLSYLPKECLHCSHLQWCKGGSRAMAYQAYGTYFTKDPFFDPTNLNKNDQRLFNTNS